VHALLITFHILTCFALILIVLLQHGKGADIGVQFGASQTVFGARGAGNFLTKLTTGAAIVFMATSFILSKLSARSDVSDILDAPGIEEPAEPEIPASTIEPEPLEGEGASELPGFEQIEPPAPAGAPAPEAAPPPEAPATPPADR
jgi:preprotein translocase subunit SecG